MCKVDNKHEVTGYLVETTFDLTRLTEDELRSEVRNLVAELFESRGIVDLSSYNPETKCIRMSARRRQSS